MTSTTPATARRNARQSGTVSFVGAGPGDLGLLTLRAVELLAQADVVVTDQLPREELLARYAGPEVEVLDAGFGDDGQPLTRATRAKLVVKAAKSAAHVVRLMDGDAASFNGLAEEALACLKAEVPFEIVPGVSAISAVPAYAGVPLTDARTRAIHVIHPAQAGVDVSDAVGADVTAVMLGAPDGVLASLSALLDAGRDPQTPVVITEQGTTVEQRTVSAPLVGAVKAARAARLAKPLMAVVGTTAALREQLSWFESKPLFGWRILVPRTREQAGSMTAKLAELGAVADVVPTISVEAPRTPQQMERAIKGMVTGRYEWVGFTSVNAVKAVRERFEEFGLDARAFSGLKVAAVGGATAKALQEWGIQPDLVPERGAVGARPARGLAAVRRRPGPDQPGLPAAGGHRHRHPRRGTAGHRLGGRRRDGVPHGARGAAAPGRSATRSRPVASTRWSSRRARRCATWSASPASRTPRPSSRRSGRPRRRPPRSTGCTSTCWRPRRVRTRWCRRSPSTAPGCAARRPRPARPSSAPSQRKGATRRKAK